MLSKNIFYVLFSFIVIGFFVTTSIRPSVQIFSILLFLALVSYYFYLKLNKLEIFTLSKDERLLCIAFLFMTLSAIPPLLLNDSLSVGLRELDLPSKYLLFLFIILLILKTKPLINKDILFISIGSAGILNGAIALSQLYIFKDFLFAGRVQGFSGINEYGIICGALCILNFILFIYNEHRFRIFFFIASIFSFIGVAGSGLRGVILAVIFSIIIIFIINLFTKAISLKNVLKYFMIFIFFGLIAGYAILQTMPNDRLEYTKLELETMQKGDYSSSIGLRLVMYKESIAMFLVSPIVGLSAKSTLDNADKIANISHTQKILDQAKEGKPIFGKRHNEILNFMAQRGIIGLFSLLFFYFAVFKICSKNLKTNIFGMLGIGMMLVYIGVGFSGDPLTGHPESTFFALALSFFVLLQSKYIHMEKSKFHIK